MTLQTTESGVLVPQEREERMPARPAQQSTDLLSAVAQAATDPRVDVEKMRALFDMRNEELQRVARETFYAAKARAQAEIEPVAKRAWNAQTKSNYAKLGEMLKMIVPVYTRHGFAQSSGTEGFDDEGRIVVVVTLSHEAGHAETYRLPQWLDATGIAGSVNKTRPHATRSSITYAVGDLTRLIWNIPLVEADDDGNAAGGEPVRQQPEPQRITEEQRANLQARCEAVGIDIAAFCRAARVESLRDITVAMWPKALARVEAREKAEKEKQA